MGVHDGDAPGYRENHLHKAYKEYQSNKIGQVRRLIQSLFSAYNMAEILYNDSEQYAIKFPKLFKPLTKE